MSWVLLSAITVLGTTIQYTSISDFLTCTSPFGLLIGKIHQGWAECDLVLYLFLHFSLEVRYIGLHYNSPIGRGWPYVRRHPAHRGDCSFGVAPNCRKGYTRLNIVGFFFFHQSSLNRYGIHEITIHERLLEVVHCTSYLLEIDHGK